MLKHFLGTSTTEGLVGILVVNTSDYMEWKFISTGVTFSPYPCNLCTRHPEMICETEVSLPVGQHKTVLDQVAHWTRHGVHRILDISVFNLDVIPSQWPTGLVNGNVLRIFSSPPMTHVQAEKRSCTEYRDKKSVCGLALPDPWPISWLYVDKAVLHLLIIAAVDLITDLFWLDGKWRVVLVKFRPKRYLRWWWIASFYAYFKWNCFAQCNRVGLGA